MKRVLIISPYFPPVNTPDMQRVRMSLPYLQEFGWEAEIDPLLLNSIPKNIIIHTVFPIPKKYTSLMGLGSIAIRSLLAYKNKVNQILEHSKFDLLFFSTTQFPVCILGGYWKKKFNIPYVIDIQDPWHTNYYLDKPKHQRPPKFWFSYRLNKYMEPIAMRRVDGLISVSEDYINLLKDRYLNLSTVPTSVITFGAYPEDFKIADLASVSSSITKEPGKFNIVYTGVVGHIMKASLEVLFRCLDTLKKDLPEIYKRIDFHFIGTSYANGNKAVMTVLPIAEGFNVAEKVTEQTNRIGFFEALKTMKSADALLIIGSDDQKYTASKLYPYIMAEKPLLAILHEKSSASTILKECSAGELIPLSSTASGAYQLFKEFVIAIADNTYINTTDWQEFEKYTARAMTGKVTQLFNEVISAYDN
jgi:hypothetical protein